MIDARLKQQIEELHCASFAWALSCCAHDHTEAEDVLQTVYLKILDGRARFEGRAAFKTWLFAVIRKTAADSWRRRLLRRVKLTEYRTSATPARHAEDPERTHYHTEIDRLVAGVVAELPRRQREVMRLVFQHDCTLSEAAEIMGVSVDSVRTHYHRGKTRVRSALAGLESENEDAAG